MLLRQGRRDCVEHVYMQCASIKAGTRLLRFSVQMSALGTRAQTTNDAACMLLCRHACQMHIVMSLGSRVRDARRETGLSAGNPCKQNLHKNSLFSSQTASRVLWWSTWRWWQKTARA